jgi:hypothetical protein
MGYDDPQKQRDYCKGHYQRNKAAYLARNARQRLEIRKYIHDEKNKPCADCKDSHPYYVMDFDHRDGTGKLYEPNRLTLVGSLWIVIEELAKCDVVCSNCHRIRTQSRLDAKEMSKE